MPAPCVLGVNIYFTLWVIIFCKLVYKISHTIRISIYESCSGSTFSGLNLPHNDIVVSYDVHFYHTLSGLAIIYNLTLSTGIAPLSTSSLGQNSLLRNTMTKHIKQM